MFENHALISREYICRMPQESHYSQNSPEGAPTIAWDGVLCFEFPTLVSPEGAKSASIELILYDLNLIPHIPLIIVDIVFLQESPELIFKTKTLMMLPLILNIGGNHI